MVTTSDCDYTSSKSIDFSGSKLEHAKVPREAAKTAHNITNNDHKGVEGRWLWASPVHTELTCEISTGYKLVTPRQVYNII